MLFKNNKQLSKTLNQIKMFAGFSKAELPKEQNEEKNPQLGGYAQLQHLGEYQKTFFYFHNNKRKALSLYNVFSYLPLSFCQHLAKLTADPKTALASDQIYLPKILPQGIPVYETVRIGSLARIVKSLQGMLLTGALLSTYPAVMLFGMAAHYVAYYKAGVMTWTTNLVVKMQLNPSKQEIVYQKVGLFGCIYTHTAKISDLQHVNKLSFENDGNNFIFLRSTKSFINQNMMFRKKSTGELLLFEIQGMWHDQGINHELLK